VPGRRPLCARCRVVEADRNFIAGVALDGSVPDEELLELIDHSYELVVARLSRAERKGLAT
jgi:hypothetical protein